MGIQKIIEKIYERKLLKIQSLGTFKLPELSDCTLFRTHCSSMTPQGICVTENYIVITAYCSIRRLKKELKNCPKSEMLYHKVKDEPVHHSCLMVFSKKDHRYLALLELPDTNHVGGIAYDGNNLWIAKSTDRCLSVIREASLEQIMNSRKGEGFFSAEISYYQKDVPCDMTASFVTYFQGEIWTGTFVSGRGKGILRSFQIQKVPEKNRENFQLVPKRTIEIPAGANGAYFYQAPDQACYLFINTANGRKKPSGIFIYRYFQEKDGAFSLKKKKCIRFLPPLIEEGCIEDGVLYTLFESSSPPYRDNPCNRCIFPVDVVCMTTPEKIL